MPRNLIAAQATMPRTTTRGRLTVTGRRVLSRAAVGAGGQFCGGAAVVLGGEAAARRGAGRGVLLPAPLVVRGTDVDGSDADDVAEAALGGHRKLSFLGARLPG